ncbi:MAG: hypothetical protein K2K94_07295 [Muribaculaceae bacterium]|nr:hypothetical protein [Muribaculaceae bacterium]
MKVLIYLFTACIIALAIFSCSAKSDGRDDSSFKETVSDKKGEEDLPVMIGAVTPSLDSAQMRLAVESMLWKNVLEFPEEGMDVYSLEPVSDLEYLPYLHLCASSPINRISLENNLLWGKLYIYMCSSVINDKALFNAGKLFVEEINRRHEGKHFEYYTKRNGKKGKRIIWTDWEYPDSFGGASGPFTRDVKRDLKLTYVDTLRVKVVMHNDRKALAKLEQYYRNKNDEKGLAIYYKVMLGYKGNGDLAERFYKVLAPELDRNPQLTRTVREVLLRAAMCDHNARAKELCDSLGFSLCDYRLPRFE